MEKTKKTGTKSPKNKLNSPLETDEYMKNSRIKHHENLLRVIAEVEDYAIYFMDTNGIIQSWNRGAQKIKGYNKSEIVGKHFSRFYPEEDIFNDKPGKLLEIAIKSGRVHDEGWRIRKDGSSFWAGVTITSAFDENGKVIGFGKVVRDLTEKKMAERAYILEIKNKQLEQFNYIASHDLLEPLRNISNYTHLLEEELKEIINDEQRLYYLRAIKESTDKMGVLLRALLDYSRLGRSSNFVAIDCNKIVKNVLKSIEDKTARSKAVIKVDPLPVILGVEEEITLLFQNLIENALKFKKENLPPVIAIGCKEGFSHSEFFIYDNGIGIDHKNAERIFQIFQRLNKENEFDGYGIGLAICKKIVEAHNGNIWVESDAGKGSTFKFIISKFI